jgi:hypothetical protein
MRREKNILAELMGIMAVLVVVTFLPAGTANIAEAAVVNVRPPVPAGADPGAVVITPVEPCAQPPITVRPPFAVRPAFNPFFLQLPPDVLNPCAPTFFNMDFLFVDEDFILGVKAVQ